MTIKADAGKATAPKVAIGICTYNRGVGLSALLAVLGKQRLSHLNDNQVIIVAVDNSPSGAARSTCTAYSERGRFALEYVHEPRKGLAVARNAVVRTARRHNATHLAFVDDDELPHPDWLQNLFTSLQRMGAEAAVGPVYPIFASPPAVWLPITAFVTRREPRDGFVDGGNTGNCIVEMAAINNYDLKFDERFNETGGEDTFFFKKLRDCGGRIAWAEDAVVHEVVLPNRMKAVWLLRRWYRTGTLEAELCRYSPTSSFGRIFNFGRGLARLGVGGLRIVEGAAYALLGRPDRFIASFYTFCRGAGLVASVFGHRYKEYAEATYQ